jgi:ParB-like chromosome segregation protein Spo0J
MNELYHPVANIFPMMSPDEFEALKADIAANGLIEPIWFFEGRIIDGRNRWEACTELKIEPAIREWGGDGSLVSFVVSLNLKRRHLNSSQLAVVSLKVLPMQEEEARSRQGKRNDLIDISQKIDTSSTGRATENTAAIITGTNRQYISDAKSIQAKAPELIAEIMAGNMNIPEAKKEIKKRARAEYIEEQRAEIAAENLAQPTGLYDVISLDPPWPDGREYDPDGSRAANPYPEMSIAEIKEIEIPNKPDAVIFLWTTHKFLPDAFAILAG